MQNGFKKQVGVKRSRTECTGHNNIANYHCHYHSPAGFVERRGDGQTLRDRSRWNWRSLYRSLSLYTQQDFVYDPGLANERLTPVNNVCLSTQLTCSTRSIRCVQTVGISLNDTKVFHERSSRIRSLEGGVWQAYCTSITSH